MNMIPYKQLSLADVFSDCQKKFENDKYYFLSLLENTINLNEFIPISFISRFYSSTGKPRKYHLHAMIWSLILQRIFSIPTNTLLITFLNKTQNEKTLHADLLLAGITQLITITVVVADKIHQHKYIRSLKPLIA